MIRWINHYVWFIKESAKYLEKSIVWMLLFGQVKAIKHANYMTKYDKLPHEQRDMIYANMDRMIWTEKEEKI